MRLLPTLALLLIGAPLVGCGGDASGSDPTAGRQAVADACAKLDGERLTGADASAIFELAVGSNEAILAAQQTLEDALDAEEVAADLLADANAALARAVLERGEEGGAAARASGRLFALENLPTPASAAELEEARQAVADANAVAAPFVAAAEAKLVEVEEARERLDDAKEASVAASESLEAAQAGAPPTDTFDDLIAALDDTAAAYEGAAQAVAAQATVDPTWDELLNALSELSGLFKSFAMGSPMSEQLEDIRLAETTVMSECLKAGATAG